MSSSSSQSAIEAVRKLMSTQGKSFLGQRLRAPRRRMHRSSSSSSMTESYYLDLFLAHRNKTAAAAASSSKSEGNPGSSPQLPKPKWVNPCGINPSQVKHLPHVRKFYDVTPLSDTEIFRNIILSAKNALRHSRFFKNDYVSTNKQPLKSKTNGLSPNKTILSYCMKCALDKS